MWTRFAVSACLLTVLVLLVSVSPLAAQTFYGSVLGTITDSSGAVLPKVAVTLTNTGTSERRSTISDGSGNYRFVNLVPGQYRLDVQSAGFKHFTRDAIEVEVQADVRIDVAMEVGEVNQTLEVTAQTPLLQTETTALGEVVEQEKIQAMPLNGRDVLNLASLVPGVIPQGQAMTNPTNTNNTAWGNYQIGGGLANQSAAFLDGGPLNINYVNMIALVPTQDAVQEFRVQTNNLSAEFGRFSGGVINLTTKSGTNQFHGAAYEFLRNTLLNGNTFFNNRSGLPRPPYKQNQFGANLGGPAVKEKTFFFFAYEGYRQRQSSSFLGSTPTPAFMNGDFSNLAGQNGKPIPIYDALTTCGVSSPCPSGTALYTRQPFPNNVIPTSRLDPTSQALAKFIFPQPNQPGQPFTGLLNYATNTSAIADNDQENARVDQNVSAKQRLFGRYTNWSIYRPGADPYGTPTGFNTTDRSQQVVVADTYTFSPTTVGDVRVAFLRYAFDQRMQTLGIDLTKFDWPANLNSEIPHPVIPVPIVQNYTEVYSGSQVAFILDRNDSYSIAPTLTKMAGHHTLKFGMEIRRLVFNFTQSNDTSGQFNFDNGFTSANPLSPSGSGYSWASFDLGYGASGSALESAMTSGNLMYQGYFVNDTYQVTSKLTLNVGLRWELPFPWTERYGRLDVLQPNATNPLAAATGLPLKGDLALVNSPAWPNSHSQSSHWDLLAPRVGLAYRINDKTVIRSGYGVFYIPPDAMWNLAPVNNPINSVTTTQITTANGGLTPYNTLNNAFPNGILQPAQRDPSYQSQLLGSSLSAPLGSQPYGYMQQWNINLERQFADGLMLEVAYAGSKGTHLPRASTSMNMLPDSYLALGTQLSQTVPNPFYGLISNGSLSAATTTYGQLLRPYPEYTGFSAYANGNGNSSYHSMQVKFEKRFRAGGTILAAYTWSKFMDDVETATSWNESNVGNSTGAVQDWNNLRGEKALSSSDVPQRLVVSYVLDLPVGKGKRVLGNVNGVANKLVSGWGINGVSTFDRGLPLVLTTANNVIGTFNGTSRPNVVPGCNVALSGRGESRVSEWFNTSCFTAPPAYTFGDVSRTVGAARAAGDNNWDFAAFKKTTLSERVGLEFRAEVFNLFNRVQFGEPNMALGNAAFGVISKQQNSPRTVQLALRLAF